MGKVTRSRKKYHTAAKNNKNETTSSETETKTEENNTQLSSDVSTSNIFSGINISFDDLKKDLAESVKDFDTKSTVSKKEFKCTDGLINKKEKRQMRRATFIAKLHVTKQAAIDAKAKKKREQTVITKDMKPLLDALTEIPVKSTVEDTGKSQPRTRSIQKAKKRRQNLLTDIQWFKPLVEKNLKQLIQETKKSKKK